MRFPSTTYGLDMDVNPLLGNPGTRRDWVVIAEGFRGNEQGKFERQFNIIASRIQKESWYKVSNGASTTSITTCFIDSSNSPIKLAVPAGTWPTPPTVLFDTKYEVYPKINLLYGTALSKIDDICDSIATQILPGGNFEPIILVNYPVIGGRSFGAVWCSVFTGFFDLLMHELGHTFSLYDEYGGPSGAYAAATENGYFYNACTSVDPTAWTRMVSSSQVGNLPTLAAPGGCTTTSLASGSWGLVGAYESALKVHCGAFRPSAKCRMNNFKNSFCKVCREVIKEDLLGTDIANSVFDI